MLFSIAKDFAAGAIDRYNTNHAFTILQFYIANGKDTARSITRGNCRMYNKHVFSWILCYHGMHIV